MKQDHGPRPQSLSFTARSLRVFIRTALRLIFWVKRVDYKITGTELVPKKGPAIIVIADHTSNADALFVFLGIRRPFAGIGMAELKDTKEWPAIIGWGFDKLGHIPIERGDKQSGNQAIAAGLDVLKHGQALAMCPQGRQIHPGEQTAWYPGFARYAMASGIKVYVLKFEGIDKFWVTHPDFDVPKGIGNINWKAKVRAGYVAVLDPKDYESVGELAQAVQDAHAGGLIPV
jgi:1-acyl-sn-glycerol-3-phosphate acyltransferase